MDYRDLRNLPQQDWGKKLEKQLEHGGKTLTIYSVEPQARLIGVTQPVGLLEGYTADAILVKAFEKNYKTPSKPGVVDKYGFEQQHSEPIELISFQYECIFDRACEAEMNRYRHNSKNYESGRYVDYIKHGLTIVFPDDVKGNEEEERAFIEHTVVPDLIEYAEALGKGAKRQAARRRLGFYVAVESVFSVNLRSLWHMARQRSAELSPNGKEAEPQIGSVITQMVKQIEPYLPRYYPTLLEQIAKGYR
jgi:thymidylate synthase ThyX